MNKLLRAVDENEQFYNVDNYAKNTPNDMIRTFEKMQEEAFRIQKDMFIRIKDFELLDLDEREIRRILTNAGVSKKVAGNLMNGKFTPVNYSKKRFETKVKKIERALDKLETDRRQFKLNEDFVYPRQELNEVISDYRGKLFFEDEEYNPEKFEYELDKNGRILFDTEGNPVKKERDFFGVPQIIKEGFKKATTLFEGNIPTASLPNMPMPIVQTAKANVDQNTNLTATENALLSNPLDREIARRT
jgi:hypothetical protein